MSLARIALWGPLLLAALLAGAYITMHDPFARDGTELSQVPLSEEDPSLDRVGDLKYMGGLDIPRMEQNIGGLSGLRWDAQSGRLLAITDDARWVWITTAENDLKLAGIEDLASGPLLGPGGTPFKGKENSDSEALDQVGRGWSVAFERDHRILVYEAIERPFMPSPSNREPYDPEDQFGALEENGGIEAMASGSGGILTCVERRAVDTQTNCKLTSFAEETRDFPVRASGPVAERGGVPTDAVALSDGTFLILFRSYSPAEGNTAAIIAYAPDGTRREIATFLPPLTLDNFEGLAVREEGGRTFLYIVSDDNFSGSQRTLLMKFEVLPE